MCIDPADSNRPPDTYQKLIAEQQHQIRELEQQLQQERELRRKLAAQIQTDTAFRGNRQLIEKIAGAIPGLTYIYDLNEQCNIYVNDRSNKILGYTPEEIKLLGNQLFSTIMHPDDLAKVPGNLEKLLKYQDHQIFEWEYRVRNARGEWRWLMSWDVIFSRNPDGSPKYLLGHAIDITDRKREAGERNLLIASLEKSQEIYRTLIKYYPNGSVFVFDRDLRYNLVDGQALAKIGLTKEQLEGKTLQETVPPEDLQLFESKYRAALAGEEHTFEYKYCGGIYSITIVPLKNDREAIFAGMVVSQEITEQKQADLGLQQVKKDLEIKFHKQSAVLKASNEQLREEIIEHWRAEEALRESQQQLELFFSQSLDGFLFMMLDEPIQWDDTVDKEQVLDYIFTKERVTKANDALVAIYGAAREDFIGRELNYFFSHNLARGRKVIEQLFDAGRIHVECENRKFDGTPIWVEGDYICIYDNHGKIAGHFGVQRDISDRKKAEAALRDSEERFRATVEQAAVGITHPDKTGRYLRVNQKFCEIVGYTASELLSRTWMDVTYPEDIEADLAATNRLFAGEIDSLKMEKRLVRKDGTLVWVNVTASLIQEPLSGAIYSVVVTEDISDRKIAEEALKASEERFRQLAENIESVFWAIDIQQQQLIYISPAYAKIWGRNCEELYASRHTFIDYVHPEDLVRVMEAFPKAAESEHEIEYRIIRPNGEIRWIRDRAFPIKNKTGEVYRIVGIAEDISERKQVQKELDDAQQMYQQILDAIADTILVKGPDSRIVWGNKAFRNYCKIDNTKFELAAENQCQELDCTNQYLIDDSSVFLTGQTMQIYDEPHQGYDGKVRYFDTIKSPIFNTEGQVVMTVGVSRDTTERKQAEKALRESEERFRQLAENIQDSFWLVTTKLTDILYLSPAYEQIWGRSREELYANNCNWMEWVHPEDKHLLLSAVPRLLAGNSTITEYRIVRPDGTIRWVYDRAFPILDESGKVYRIAGICEDISDRKLTADRIQAALREKEVLLKEIHHRVKNNMQVISSLLQLQAQYIEDEDTLSLFEESQTRIHSMALIHEQLYQSEHLDRIDIQPYVENLVANLSQSFGCYRSSISINLNLEPISLNIETAIPCGLIINELASNSLKYAFTQNREGEISIDFRQMSDREFHLSIRDNGTGFPEGFDVESTETLGLRLVRMLTRQLEGSLAIDSQCGTCYDIRFKELNYRRRI
ncbi:MAG: PAS domain S-box protein [Oscillatoriaceae cyanobacterium Prado104]|jgi:PAS domain S-box-containing protein|nr:PAS domain S-box protein [Oscillatoriaceae cyanobacterium Prado104]